MSEEKDSNLLVDRQVSYATIKSMVFSRLVKFVLTQDGYIRAACFGENVQYTILNIAITIFLVIFELGLCKMAKIIIL